MTHLCDLTTAWCLFRFGQLTFPLKAKIYATRENANKILVGIVVLGLACNLWRYAWNFLSDEPGPLEGHPCFPKGLLWVRGQVWGRKPDHYIYVFVIFIVPLFLLLFLNFGVVYSLISGMRKKGMSAQSKSKSDAAQHRLTVTATCLITLFVICEIPSCLDRILRLVGYAVQELGNFSRKAGICLLLVDSSLNFFIYFVTIRAFRRQLHGGSQT
jgi:hypothetical protein